jgi:hypothetical protein
MDNSRYPHTIKITRTISISATEPIEEVPYDPFAPPPSDPPEQGDVTTEVLEIYDGKGRNYKSNKTNPTNGVLQTDYAVSIPFTVIEIKAGDSITVIERNRTMGGVIEDSYLGNLGLTVFWNKVNN